MQVANLRMHRISSRGTGSALARCVGDVDQFLSTEWAHQPHHHASGNCAGFADLLSFVDVDRLLSTTFPRLPSFRLVRDGKMLDRSTYTRKAGLASELLNDVGDVGRIFHEFHNGATIVLQGLPNLQFVSDAYQ
jgi:bifunctional lysine-specific demethylase and histidyl-hydroxylase NO66